MDRTEGSLAMHQQQRLNLVLEFVSEQGNVSIAEVSEKLAVSTATARRDLNSLAEQRLVTRTHGGATALGSGYELPLQYKIARQADAKLAIARAVEQLISPGATIGLNGGTTVTEVARALGRSEHLRTASGEPGVTIVTNALNIAFESSVREHIKIIVTGGVPRRQSYELIGPLVATSLRDFSLDVAVLGVDGLTPEFGATTLHEGEADASRHIASIAGHVIVAADQTKIGRRTFARICPLAGIDTLITDAPLAPQVQAEFDRAKVNVIVAPSLKPS
jgi:DeoR family transcriptional regulator of aga operon